MSQIPLVDLRWQHEAIAAEVEEGFARVLGTTAFVLGPDVSEFEQQFALFCEVKNCVGVGNGTDALELVLRALDAGSGDEVILPTNSFIATALAVARTGARPVLVDCDPTFYLIDPERVESALTDRTRAILPVHLYGQIAPLNELETFAVPRGIPLIEDAAQAQGARQEGRPAGSLGRAAGTSFYPGKNLGAYGDGGAVLTQDEEIAKRVSALRGYGSDRKYHHPERGFNSRLDTLQAVVLNAKLKRLAEWNDLRRRAAERYDELLEEVDGVARPSTRPGNEHVWHLYVIRVGDRDGVLARLHEAGVGAGIHYPQPIHLTGAFRDLGYAKGTFPVAEQAADEILSLPLFPGISEEQQVRVVEELKRCR